MSKEEESAYERIRQFIVEHPELSANDVMEEARQMGLTLADSGIASIRSHVHSVLRTLKRKGFLEPTYAERVR